MTGTYHPHAGRSLRRAAFALPLAVAMLAFLAFAPPTWAAESETSLISRASGINGLKSNGDSRQHAVSADGRYVAFESKATNLDPADSNDAEDVYVRDLQTNTTTLVSRASGASGAKGNGVSNAPMISANGRYVAFESKATNLDPADPNDAEDVYVRDLQQHTNVLVSRATGASGAKGNGESLWPYISADGRYITFVSKANNLHPDDADTSNDVYVRDLQQNTTALVSRASGVGGAKSNSSAFNPSVSADGRFVSFGSSATNLHSDDADSSSDIFVRDLQQNSTILVSRASGANGATGNSGGADVASISADGRYIVFDFYNGSLHPDDPDDTNDIYLRDLQTNTTTLASRASGANGSKGNNISTLGNNISTLPSLSAISSDGRYIVFQSSASNLHPDDTDNGYDIFRRDMTIPSDTTPPKVKRVVPAENATGIAPGVNVSAFFSEAMRVGSIDTNTVKLFKKGSTTPIASVVSYDASTKKAVLNPNTNLRRGAKYKAVVTTGAQDLAGNQLDQDQSPSNGLQPKTWFFTVRP